VSVILSARGYSAGLIAGALWLAIVITALFGWFLMCGKERREQWKRRVKRRGTALTFTTGGAISLTVLVGAGIQDGSGGFLLHFLVEGLGVTVGGLTVLWAMRWIQRRHPTEWAQSLEGKPFSPGVRRDITQGLVLRITVAIVLAAVLLAPILNALGLLH
jgi:hypothetical protein